ncbi:hypothetical protein RchiOBHm_Chr5g0009771 [Rosa chinensis]|uniref:Uncharacterized protein n=1 Tax=Rosa chinensis TaxID=74649 RepID=A0A2P6Q4F4_ROSCH|nr:hypothetical protein RchiOBHm_Chr5g0009771 [Rosa chinensis]
MAIGREISQRAITNGLLTSTAAYCVLQKGSTFLYSESCSRCMVI